MKNIIELSIVVEKAENSYQGRLVDEGHFAFYDSANSIDELETQLKEAFEDYLQFEGKDDEKWKNVSIENVKFNINLDLTELFELFTMLNISKVADYIGINSSQMRQYASGKRNPSEKQALLIQNSIHKLADSLKRITLV